MKIFKDGLILIIPLLVLFIDSHLWQHLIRHKVKTKLLF